MAKTVFPISAQEGILCKVGQLKYLEPLQQGILYTRPLRFYRQRQCEGESQNGRFDMNEGLLAKNVSFIIEVNNHSVIVKDTSLYAGQNYPIFCCYEPQITHTEVTGEGKIHLPSEFLKCFADDDPDSLRVLILSKSRFLEKVRHAALKIQLQYNCRNVYYQEFTNSLDNYSNYPKILFRKDPQFMYQNEFRFVFRIQIDDHMVICLGDLSEISLLLRPEEFDSLVIPHHG